MPQPPPAPIHARIDTQEQRSGIPALLAAMPQVHIEVTPLHMGDYDVGGNPRRVFERKTGVDFSTIWAQDAYSGKSSRFPKTALRPILFWKGTPLCSITSQS